MKIRNLTCIVCPRGCQLKVTLTDSGEVTLVEGNACKRGDTYAHDECTHPMRTVTSTVRCEGGRVLPVKTASAVPKEKMLDVMKEINIIRVKGYVKIGDVIIENVAQTGVNVIATANQGE